MSKNEDYFSMTANQQGPILTGVWGNGRETQLVLKFWILSSLNQVGILGGQVVDAIMPSHSYIPMQSTRTMLFLKIFTLFVSYASGDMDKKRCYKKIEAWKIKMFIIIIIIIFGDRGRLVLSSFINCCENVKLKVPKQ